MNVITDHLGEFGDGLLLTVELTLLALAGALAVGVLVAAMRVSPVRVLRAAGMAYVEVLQNIPLLVWLVIAVFGLPEIGVIAGLFTTSAVVIALYQGRTWPRRSGPGSTRCLPGRARPPGRSG